MNTTKAEQAFELLDKETVSRYCDYWQGIAPKTEEDVFRRWLFAFTSIHTSWQGNVRGYEAIKDLGWMDDKEDLLHRLTVARCGMQNGRTKFIWDFKEQFWNNPKQFYKVESNYIDLRNKLVPMVNGIGIAKVSFVLEMVHPLEAELTCIDTHGIQLYDLGKIGFKSKKDVAVYHEVENHWVEKSLELNCPAYISRCIFWDSKQQKSDTRYWSYVLEEAKA